MGCLRRICAKRVDRRALTLAPIRVKHESKRNADVQGSDIVLTTTVNTRNRKKDIVEDLMLNTDRVLVSERSL